MEPYIPHPWHLISVSLSFENIPYYPWAFKCALPHCYLLISIYLSFGKITNYPLAFTCVEFNMNCKYFSFNWCQQMFQVSTTSVFEKHIHMLLWHKCFVSETYLCIFFPPNTKKWLKGRETMSRSLQILNAGVLGETSHSNLNQTIHSPIH